jgi:hypothetical protein
VRHRLTLLLPLVLLACNSERAPSHDVALVPLPDGYLPPPVDAGKADVPRTDADTVPGCQFIAPTGPKAKNPVTFKVAVTGAIVRVRYVADGWPLGESTDAAASFPVSYSFSQLGPRTINAHGDDADGNELTSCSLSVEVEAGYPDVPYFYQYDNTLSPASTCQNTSVAMVLAYLGWTGKPDDITTAWGKDHAQSPSGLAEVFNDYAQKMGISERLVPHTDGTVQNVRDLLAQGKPVIVHGYFTSYGHVLVALGFTGSDYVVHDPAGVWSEVFKGGYPSGQTSTSGKAVSYGAAAFEAAIATSDGTTFLPIWYHELK